MMDALHLAARCGRAETVRILLEAGADIDAHNGDGKTALYQAVNYYRAETVSILLKAGANIDARDKHGKTALHIAAYQDDNETVSILLEAGANIDACDEHGNTALHIAAYQGRAAIVRILLKAGANIYARDKRNMTALQEATSSDRLKTRLRLLRETLLRRRQNMLWRNRGSRGDPEQNDTKTVEVLERFQKKYYNYRYAKAIVLKGSLWHRHDNCHLISEILLPHFDDFNEKEW
jgi:ankyrin repeat protein